MKYSKTDNVTRYRIEQVILALYGGDVKSLSELAKKCDQAPPNHRRLLDRLVKCGLVERPSHGRYKLHVRANEECLGYYWFDWFRTYPDCLVGDYKGDCYDLRWGYIGCPESDFRDMGYFSSHLPAFLPDKKMVSKNNSKRRGWFSWL